MFLFRAGLSFGLLVALALPNISRALPLTTTLPPAIPGRTFLNPPPFEINPVEFPEIGKRPLGQQPHENVKYPRGWGAVVGDFFDPNFRVEPGNVQSYYGFNEHPESDYFAEEGEEEETNEIDAHLGDARELDADVDSENDVNAEELAEEREGSPGLGSLLGGLIGGLAQLSSGVKQQKPTPKPGPVYFPAEYETDTVKNVDVRAKPPLPARGGYGQFTYQPNLPPPPFPVPQPLELRRMPKDGWQPPMLVEEPVIVEQEKPIYSRTTTISKTTSWYLDNNSEPVLVEDTDTIQYPLKVKYEKTSRTSSTGPMPPYMQEYEDVLFHEENERTKSIIEKLSDLRGLNPTAITSYTTSPGPSTTEVHEEVLFVEDFSQVKSNNYEMEIKLSPEPIPLLLPPSFPPPQPLPTPVVLEESCEEPIEEQLPEKPVEEQKRSHFFIDGVDSPINIDDLQNEAIYEEPKKSHFFIDGGDTLIDIDTIDEVDEKPAPRKAPLPSPHSPSTPARYPQPQAQHLPPPPPTPPAPPPSSPLPLPPHSPSPPSHSPLSPPPPPPHSPPTAHPFPPSPPPPPPHPSPNLPPPPLHSSSPPSHPSSPPPPPSLPSHLPSPSPPPHPPSPPTPMHPPTPPTPPHPPSPPTPQHPSSPLKLPLPSTQSPQPPPHSPPQPPPYSPSPQPPSRAPSPLPRLPSPSLSPSHPSPETSFPHQPSAGPKSEQNHNQAPSINRPQPLGAHPQSIGSLPQQQIRDHIGPRPGNPFGAAEHQESPMLKEEGRQRVEKRPVFPARPNPNRPGLH